MSMDKLKIGEKMEEYGLIGYPLGHSLSSVIHNELFKISSHNASYKLIEIPLNELNSHIADLKRLNGFNVTIPYKTDIIQQLDALSEKAELFGAVNTVKCSDKCVGYNTDCTGFTSAAAGAGMELGKKVLLLGAGGVARMIACEAVISGAELTVAVRNKQKALTLIKEIADKLKKEVNLCSFEEISGEYDLLVNGTPVGMFPNTETCPVNENVIKNCKSVFDTIYNPSKTKLLQIAEKNGLKVSNGLSMLVRQAAAAHEIWYGAKFSNEEINKVINITAEQLK